MARVLLSLLVVPIRGAHPAAATAACAHNWCPPSCCCRCWCSQVVVYHPTTVSPTAVQEQLTTMTSSYCMRSAGVWGGAVRGGRGQCLRGGRGQQLGAMKLSPSSLFFAISVCVRGCAQCLRGGRGQRPHALLCTAHLQSGAQGGLAPLPLVLPLPRHGCAPPPPPHACSQGCGRGHPAACGGGHGGHRHPRGRVVSGWNETNRRTK